MTESEIDAIISENHRKCEEGLMRPYINGEVPALSTVECPLCGNYDNDWALRGGLCCDCFCREYDKRYRIVEGSKYRPPMRNKKQGVPAVEKKARGRIALSDEERKARRKETQKRYRQRNREKIRGVDSKRYYARKAAKQEALNETVHKDA